MTQAATSWPTPDASVANDGESLDQWDTRRERVKAAANNGNGMGEPIAMAAQRFPRPETTMPDGEACSNLMPTLPQPRRLNLRFVEWLMGFPTKWVEGGGATLCERWATRSSSTSRR
ncbi:MAG: hypothetical protein AAGI53_09570 [Planctomycetota bacterium]